MSTKTYQEIVDEVNVWVQLSKKTVAMLGEPEPLEMCHMLYGMIMQLNSDLKLAESRIETLEKEKN
jgi:hypothetical protein